jgi:hypothetical protein
VIRFTATAPADDATIGKALLHKESIMGRSTFEGPVLSGDNRFGPQRDVGPVLLTQQAFLDFAVTTANTANYGGGSKVFVTSNNIPNNAATIWTAQNGVYSNSGPTVGTAPTADVTGTIYRGAVFLIPQGSNITDVIVDVGTLPTDGTHTASSIQPYVSNAFATSTGVYATMSAITTATRGTATFVGTQLDYAFGTLQDVQNIQPGQQPSWFSQVVVTLAITGSSLATPTTGQIAVTLKYAQQDMNIGNATTYPYGNFD